MAFPKIKLSDDSGNAVGVTDNRLDVNVAGATMSTGDITIDSEFPAAATIADDFANPDTTSVMSMLMGYDSSGSNWNRLLTGTGAMSPSVLRVTLATDDLLLNAMNTNLADIETLLGTIDTDTGSIVTNVSGLSSAIKISGSSWQSVHSEST